MAKLYVIATPIGNLNDLTPRMHEALAEAALIAAEDTRVTLKLLNHFELKKPMISCHRHNEMDRAPELVERMLSENLTVALTCDAGTPGISDPGYLLVDGCWAAGIPVVPVSGPSAVITALSASGFDAREFAFYGFLPREKKGLAEKLDSIRTTGIPVAVLYESPHRITNLTTAIAERWPDSRLCVCSDLTKHYERIYRGRPEEVLEMLKANPAVEKGEYCIVCEVPAAEPMPQQPAIADPRLYLLSLMMDGRSLREAQTVAKASGLSRNEVYRAALDVQAFLNAT